MKKVLAITAVLVVLSSLAFAGTPNVQVIFDNGRGATDCTGDYIPGYVVARNFDCYFNAIEFKVNYGAGIIRLPGEVYTSSLVIGNTVTGLSMAWSAVQARNGYTEVLLVTFLFRCTCGQDIKIQVVPHPLSGFVRAVDVFTGQFVYGYGETSLLCPTVPTENTTWGGVKALYE